MLKTIPSWACLLKLPFYMSLSSSYKTHVFKNLTTIIHFVIIPSDQLERNIGKKRKLYSWVHLLLDDTAYSCRWWHPVSKEWSLITIILLWHVLIMYADVYLWIFYHYFKTDGVRYWLFLITTKRETQNGKNVEKMLKIRLLLF